MSGSFTYDAGDINTDLAKTRLLLGDTTSPGDMSDEELEYFLGIYVTPAAAAAAASRGLAARWASAVDKAVGDLKIQFSQKWEHYAQVAQDLTDTTNSLDPPQIYVAGIHLSERDMDAADISISHPRFEVGMHNLAPSDPTLTADDLRD